MKEQPSQPARKRVEQCHEQMMRTMKSVRDGEPLAAEPDAERADKRLRSRARRIVGPPVDEARNEGRGAFDALPERIWGPTRDFVGVAFLERGLAASRTVGRVAYRDGRALGSGFLVAPGLFLTNNHVLGSPSECGALVVEFDYELDPRSAPRTVTAFELDPERFWITDATDDLDYTLVAIGRRSRGTRELGSLGYCPLSDATDKHALGEVANVVQHPDGRYKEVVLRENRLVSRLSHVLHYVADTEPGSSGSPVFNNEWRAIALHHWGGPWRQRDDANGQPLPRSVNEGIRISAIVSELKDRRGELEVAQRQVLDAALASGERSAPVVLESVAPADVGPRVGADGTVTWSVPIEISVRVPVPTAAPVSVGRPSEEPTGLLIPAAPSDNGSERFRRRVDENYARRKGFQEDFVPGFGTPLPRLSRALRERAARNQRARPDESPFALPYEHFSVVVDGTRGLPLFTASNIDGKNLKQINRRTGAVTRAESLVLDEPEPEARETWYVDPRIDPSECGDDRLYTGQRVSDGPNRLGRMFHRGHMVRRLDPCWGRESVALRAEADTFHFTNCTPQIGSFNGGRSLWLGIENHVLDNALSEDLRLSVYTGPVLGDGDPPYRDDVFDGFRVPLRYWKIVCWSDDGEPAVLAMIADQSPLLDELPERLERAERAGHDRREGLGDVDDVDDFVATVPEIERLTGLDFGAAIRAADLYEDVVAEGLLERGQRRLRSFDELDLRRGAARRNRAGE